MFSSIPAFRTELHDRLRAVLPSTWKIEADLAAPAATLEPAVYLEFTELGSTFNGQPVPHGVLAATANLILTDPRTDRAGEAAVEEHLVTLIAALDPHEDLGWSRATKERIETTGSLAWALTLTAFVATTNKE